ncbi:MAG TPA: hypothetical protein VII94_00270 [Candidatus Saccharimonadales bacterium]
MSNKLDKKQPDSSGKSHLSSGRNDSSISRDNIYAIIPLSLKDKDRRALAVKINTLIYKRVAEARIDPIKIGMLRQWLNEERIDKAERFVTNEDLEFWLGLITAKELKGKE